MINTNDHGMFSLILINRNERITKARSPKVTGLFLSELGFVGLKDCWIDEIWELNVELEDKMFGIIPKYISFSKGEGDGG